MIDLNLPPMTGPPEAKPWVPSLTRLAQRLGQGSDDIPAKFTLIIFTNFSYHYDSMDSQDPTTQSFLAYLAERHNNETAHPETLMGVIESLRKYDAIPVSYPADDVRH